METGDGRIQSKESNNVTNINKGIYMSKRANYTNVN